MIRISKYSAMVLIIVGAVANCGGGKAVEAVGDLQVSVMFMNNYTITDDDATMIMVYAWDASSWNAGKPGAATSSSNDGMFMDIALSKTAVDVMANKTHTLALKGLPAGEYYVGVFANSIMNYSAESTSLIGYYIASEADKFLTMDADLATATTVSGASRVELKTMMATP